MKLHELIDMLERFENPEGDVCIKYKDEFLEDQYTYAPRIYETMGKQGRYEVVIDTNALWSEEEEKKDE